MGSGTSAHPSAYSAPARPVPAPRPHGISGGCAGKGTFVGNSITAKFHGDGSPSDNVFIKGLPLQMSQEDLEHLCGQFGAVTSVKLLPKNDKNDLAALVRFDSVHTASGAIHALHGNPLPNSTGLHVPIRNQTNLWRSSRPY